MNLPPLPEWSKRDDLGGLVPSEIRQELTAYARAALAAQPGAVPQEDVEAARQLLSDAMGTDLLSGDRKVVNSDRAAVYRLLSEAFTLLTPDRSAPTEAKPAQQDAVDAERDSAHYSEQLTRAKRLIVDVWQRHPETRDLIEARTGSWFVWGEDRAAISAKKGGAA